MVLLESSNWTWIMVPTVISLFRCKNIFMCGKKNDNYFHKYWQRAFWTNISLQENLLDQKNELRYTRLVTKGSSSTIMWTTMKCETMHNSTTVGSRLSEPRLSVSGHLDVGSRHHVFSPSGKNTSLEFCYIFLNTTMLFPSCMKPRTL